MLSPLTKAAIFLVVVVRPGPDNADAVRGLCGDLAGLVRAVGFRDLEGFLTCVTGFSAATWDRLAGGAEAGRAASVPGVHARVPGTPWPRPATCCSTSARRGWTCCFELATQIMAKLGDAVTVVDEVHGFRYFDERDFIGFVDEA